MKCLKWLACWLILLTLLTAGCSGSSVQGEAGIPTPASLVISGFIWQTDGLCGYRMLRPEGWEASSSECRFYTLPGSKDEADRLALRAMNYQVLSAQMLGGIIAQYRLFEQDPSLDGWTKGIEQMWGSNGIEFTLLETLPQAKVYSVGSPGSADVQIVAYAIDDNQPLGIELVASGAHADIERLRSDRILDDFVFIVESLSAIPYNPENVDPTLTEPKKILPALLPTNPPSPTPTAASIALPQPTAVPVEMYPPPLIEEMATVQPEGGAWTTYIPADWQERIRQKQEVPTIVSIVVSGDGSVWFASMGGAISSGTGIYRYDGQTWTHHTRENGLPADEITAMVVAPDGALWFSTLCCGVSRYDGRSWRTYTAANGLASDDVRSMAVAPDGALWFGTSGNGVSRFDGRNWETYTTQNGLSGNYVGHIAVLPDGALLVSASDGSRAGLDRFDGQGWSRYPTEWTGRGKYTQDVAFSLDGALWFVTEFDGVYRLLGDEWTHYTIGDGLAGEWTRCGAVASDGAVWFGTDQGVSRFDGKNWTTFTTRDGLASNWINAIAAASDGSIWVGESGGISRYLPSH